MANQKSSALSSNNGNSRTNIGTAETVHLLEEFRTGRFEDVLPYLADVVDTDHGHDFWKRSGGVEGMLSHLRDTRLIVRLLQLQVSTGQISSTDGRYVWEAITKQIWCTALALPEAFICWICKGIPHAYGLCALRYHYDVSLRAYTVCSTEDVDIDLSRLV